SRSAGVFARAISCAVSRSNRSVFQRLGGAATIRESRSSMADNSYDSESDGETVARALLSSPPLPFSPSPTLFESDDWLERGGAAETVFASEFGIGPIRSIREA